MKNVLQYKNYLGSVEVDLDGNAVVGRLLHISDVITYSAARVDGIEQAFRDAVDDYLATCAECGDDPDRPCKGVFNVRIQPDLHRDAVLKARQQGISLNQLVERAILAHCGAGAQTHVHIHLDPATTLTAATSSSPSSWETLRAAAVH